ncbi:hypothetical protein ACFL2T_03690 [Elusimicrobiota bacterium]
MVQAIISEAKRECGIPDKIHAYSEGMLREFGGQWVYPKKRMLTTAFLRGFAWPNSDYMASGTCVAVFLNVALDPDWEGALDPMARAKEFGVVPSKRLVELRPDGSILYEPLPN